MKRFTTLFAASLLATAFAAAPALAQGKSGDAPGHGGDGPGASASAPGHNKSDGDRGTGTARGLLKADKEQDGMTTAAVAKNNFGTLISSIRAGKSGIGDIASDAEITVIEAADLIQGENHVALENALADNESEVEALRDDLAALAPDGLTEEEIDRVVAARVEADGSLTVYLY